ncbi:endonuclease/exonuclease/phosphatase family protein [Modicisalibacter luteus]|uniref:endonuclease/exonuclease/phosphatase family protein n=1 Tax=Modicisalibacter luteus TaxID=453962 RepID=UPI003627D041
MGTRFRLPRLQLAALAAVVGAAQWLWGSADWRWWSIAACAAVAFIQAAHILPWTPLWPKSVRTATSNKEMQYLTLMVSNVLTPNRNAQGLLEQIHEHQPEIVLTLESDAWWGSSSRPPRRGMAVQRPNTSRQSLWHASLFANSPRRDRGQVADPERYSVDSHLAAYAMRRTNPLPCPAPAPPAPSESEQSLWRDAELLLVGKDIHRHEQPTLLAGDLNDVAWSRTTRRFCRVSGMLDPRRGRGMFSTFHASYPLIRWPLDHIFISEHFTLVNMQRLKNFGSDHFPIIATLCYRPARADENDTPEADREERKEATETIEEARQQGDGEA